MEQLLVSVSAQIFQYDGDSNQWKEIGSESGPSTLSILKSPTNEYRYVAQKVSNNELVLNAYIFPEMKYDQSTPNFHQWFDKANNAFGVNFSDTNMAKKYAAAISCALEQLNAPQIPQKSPTNVSERSTFGGGSTNSTKKVTDSSSRSRDKVSPYATSTVGANTAPAVPTSAPKTTPVKASAGAPPPPGPPPAAPAPPGPPPPGPAVAKVSAPAGNDFASQLQRAAAQHKAVDIDEQLSKPQPVVAESRPSVTAPAAGGMDFLTEMKQRMSKKTTNEVGSAPALKPSPVKSAPTHTTNVNQTLPSATNVRSHTDSEPLSSSTYVTAADLDKFRNDLMKDILLNMEKMKNEIISSISAKLN